jgi:hypothetical protein
MGASLCCCISALWPQVFEWELLGALLSMFNTLLGSSSGLGSGTLSSLPGQTLQGRLSEKGVLQLLLDVRLLRDVLAGGRPLGSRAAPAAAASAGAAGGGAGSHARYYMPTYLQVNTH